MSRDIIAYINQVALQHNLNRIKTFARYSKILAMIKSNGYGHGLLSGAHALKKADAFGVACLEEALILRQEKIKKPIVVMPGFLDQQELLSFATHDLTAVVHHPFQLKLLEKMNLAKPVNVWLKIDTGMNRLGFDMRQTDEIYKRLSVLNNVLKPIGIMSHLAEADNENEIFTKQQIYNFSHYVANIPAPKSIVNSAGIVSYPNAHFDWVRPGIMLYGVSPFSDQTGEVLGLKPVMTLQAKLIATKDVKKNDYIGYGCTWRAPEDMLFGIVAAGYGDGYPRHARSGTPVLVQKTTCSLVGCVSMDLITIDLRNKPDAKIGDIVTLWGGDLPVETVAKHSDTIAYELLCGVTKRVKFVEKGF